MSSDTGGLDLPDRHPAKAQPSDTPHPTVDSLVKRDADGGKIYEPWMRRPPGSMSTREELVLRKPDRVEKLDHGGKVYARSAVCPACGADAMHPVLNFASPPAEQRCLNVRCDHQWVIGL